MVAALLVFFVHALQGLPGPRKNPPPAHRDGHPCLLPAAEVSQPFLWGPEGVGPG